MSRCKAMRMSDQMVCRACNLVWDVNDPEPPECKAEQEAGTVAVIVGNRPSAALTAMLRAKRRYG